MNSPAFLLALAPAATAVASRTVAAAKETGASFASMLGNMLDAPTSSTTTPTENKPTFAETVQSLAEELRNWLSEHGVGGGYSIDYHLSADGEPKLAIDGDSAGKVEQLLASDSSWLDKLQQLASALQIKSAQLSRDYLASSVTLEIDPQHANAF